MLKKEKIKIILYLVLTPVLIVLTIVIAILISNKYLIFQDENSKGGAEVLNAINHTHNI